MARAFAEATGEVEAFDKAIEEQNKKLEVNKKSQDEYIRSLDKGVSADKRRKQSVTDLSDEYKSLGIAASKNVDVNRRQVTALKAVEAAQQRLTNVEVQGRQRTTEHTAATIGLQDAHKKLAGVLKDTLNITPQVAGQRAREVERIIAQRQATESLIETEGRLAQQRRQIVERVSGSLRTLADPSSGLRQEYDATQKLSRAQKELEGTGLSASRSQERLHTALHEQYRAFGFLNKAQREEAQVKRAQTEANNLYLRSMREVENEAKSGGHRQASSAARQIATSPKTGKPTELSGQEVAPDLKSSLKDLQGEFGNLSNSASGFASHARNIFGVFLTTAIQPFSALLVGLVGTYGSLASAAIAAGTAISTTWLSAVAQGVPVMGLFSAAMERMRNVLGFVATSAQRAQQAFIAQYQYQQQVRMGIDPIVIAEHNLSDALFQQQLVIRNITVSEHNYKDALYSQRQAVYDVRVAQLGLLTTRQQATRQLQQLIFQEVSAKLAAEASTLAITDSQKALGQAIARGGDVQQAQLQLAQAHASHTQAVVAAQHAIADAAPGSIARQNIQQTVDQASRGVTQARRAVVDANFALKQAQIGIVQAKRAVIDSEFQVAQARAAITQARLAASGYNVAVAAQLAYLRSQMSQTERSLANNILKIFNLFRGAHGILTPMTDAILRPFIGITDEIFKLIHDPRILGALQGLANAMGKAFTTVSNVFLSNSGVSRFIDFIHAATANLGPLSRIIANIFGGMGAVVKAAIPFVHQFAGFVERLTGQFSKWANSQKGQNWLKRWFNEAYSALEHFLSLGVAVGKLIAAVAGIGGGAKSGIDLLNSLTGHVNHLTDSINHHGKAYKDLQRIWNAARPTLHALHTIISSVIGALIQLGTSKQGQKALQDIAHLVANVIVPAFAQFAANMGTVISKLTTFLDKHPAVEKMLRDLIAFSLTAHIGFRALGILAGPLTTIIHLIGHAKTLFEALSVVIGALPEGFLAAAGPIGLVAAAIVGVAAATGNLGTLWDQAKQTFSMVWKDIAQAFQPLIQAIKEVGREFHIHIGGNAHNAVKTLLKILGTLVRFVITDLIAPFVAAWTAISTVFAHVIRTVKSIVNVFKDVFKAIDDLIHGRFGKLAGDFLQIGKDIWNALWSVITTIPDMFINIFKGLIKAVENFLGISSPSKKFKSIGKAIFDGIWEVVSGLPSFFLHLAEKVVDMFIKGLKSLPGRALKAFSNAIPNPLDILHPGKGSGGIAGGFLKGAEQGALHFFEGILAAGGPIPGYGGGDTHPYLLEGGEHVLTKEEVKAAGGHGAIYAVRRMLGGGGQGGPFGFAAGGATGSFAPPAVTASSRSATVSLHNLGSYITSFLRDWSFMWAQVHQMNQNSLTDQLNAFKANFQAILKQLNNFTESYSGFTKKFYTKLNSDNQDALNQILKNFRFTYNKVDTDTFNAFWYIQHAANKSLKAFGAKPVDVTLGAQPKFAGGGFVGNMGERGRDMVHAVLGRGEAVLNYAHQKVVEPAMRAFYGWGLGDMFKKVRGEHAGPTSKDGYAAGGYVFPFSGTNWGWSRTDQGVDFGGNSPVGAIGDAVVTYSNPNDGWYSPAPAFMVYRLTNGPDKGKYVYVSEHISNMAPAGTRVKAGHSVAQMVGGIEMGWAAGPHGYQITGLPMGADHLTSAGTDFHNFLVGLQHGKIIAGKFGSGGGGGTVAQWKKIIEQHVKGSGALKEVLQHAIHRVTKAANEYGQKQADKMGGGIGGDIPGGLHGPVPRQIAQAASKVGFNKVSIAGLIGNAVQESSLQPGASGGGAAGLWQWTPPTGLLNFASAHHAAWQAVGTQVALVAQTIGRAGINAMNRSGSPAAAALWFMNNFEKPGIPMAQNRISAANQAFKQGFAKGGFAGAVPILAHVGEWVVNKTQQSNLARRIGTTIGNLKDSLGFTGGPQSFAGGGEVQRYATGRPPRLISKAQEPRSSAPDYVPDIAPPSPTGGFSIPDIQVNVPFFYQQALDAYNQAQKITLKLNASAKKFGKGLNQFMKNFNLVGGDNGIFAQAAQAIQDFANNEATTVQLAAAGFKATINKHTGLIKITRAGIQTATEQAQSDLSATNAQIAVIGNLQRSQQAALKAVNREIRKLGRPTQDNLKQYQQLIGARQQLIGDINSQDQNLAQAYTDRYNKQVALFQAKQAAALRNKPGTTVAQQTLSGGEVGAIDMVGGPGQIQSGINNLFGVFSKVGPTISQGLAAMSQTIAQTFGDPKQIQQTDQYVLAAAQEQQKALQASYTEAAKKAKKDPRWQSVADEILSQLEGATTAVAQAQAQALTDAINAVQTQGSLQSAAVGLANTLSQALAATSSVSGPANQYAAIAQQIGTSQYNVAGLSSQLSQYGALYNQAQAQGNVGAMNQLTQTMDGLRGEIAQANVQTQQLITQYQQLSVTLQATIASQTSSYNQAATGIFQTIGQILGNQNLPALIQAARELGQSLVQSGQQAIGNIQTAMGSGGFGAAQGGANSFLSQAIAAFQGGPQAFATWLAANGPSLSTFASGLPSDQQTLFNGLIQALTDNTTAVVTNNLNLQQLNATTNQQQFASSAWTLFRQAIFNGIGGLLPQFAMTVPSLDVGGVMMSSGLVYGHKGETITPASVRRGDTAKSVHQENHFHYTQPMEVADPVLHGNQVAWRLNHDPNSR